MAAAACLAIEARDDGSGMSEAIQRRIFEPFFTTKEGRGGTGFGLSAVQATVDAHDGAIEVASVEGQGTRFVVYRPLALAQVQSMAKVNPGLGLGSGRILVVDDEPVLPGARRAPHPTRI